jgi:hypothetical protein
MGAGRQRTHVGDMLVGRASTWQHVFLSTVACKLRRRTRSHLGFSLDHNRPAPAKPRVSKVSPAWLATVAQSCFQSQSQSQPSVHVLSKQQPIARATPSQDFIPALDKWGGHPPPPPPPLSRLNELQSRLASQCSRPCLGTNPSLARSHLDPPTYFLRGWPRPPAHTLDPLPPRGTVGSRGPTRPAQSSRPVSRGSRSARARRRPPAACPWTRRARCTRRSSPGARAGPGRAAERGRRARRRAGARVEAWRCRRRARPGAAGARALPSARASPRVPTSRTRAGCGRAPPRWRCGRRDGREGAWGGEARRGREREARQV